MDRTGRSQTLLAVISMLGISIGASNATAAPSGPEGVTTVDNGQRLAADQLKVDQLKVDQHKTDQLKINQQKVNQQKMDQQKIESNQLKINTR